jgi:hypothetical protein
MSGTETAVETVNGESEKCGRGYMARDKMNINNFP